MPQPSGKALLLSLFYALTIQLSHSRPSDWYLKYNTYGLAKPACDAQPTTTVPGSVHGIPRTDSSTTLTFTNSAGQTVNTTCPGSTYTVVVSFGSSRLALLTATTGTATFTSPSPTSGCPNRLDLGGSGARSSYTAVFTPPCSAAGKTSVFMVTSSPRTTWYQASRTLAVVGSISDAGGAACAAALATCGLTAPAASPPPSGASRSPLSPPPPPVKTSSPPPPASGTASPPPPPPDTTAPSGDGYGDEDDVDEGDEEGPSPPPALTSTVDNGISCTPSTLGYTCMRTVAGVTVHWSVNTASAPAGNGCTPANTTTLQATELAQYGTLHMAVQSPVKGYVSIGFNPTDPSSMYPADVILGWAGGTGNGAAPYLKTFFVSREDMDEGDVYPSSGSSWAYDNGVSYDSASGTTTLCFSRRLVDSRARVSGDLRGAVGASSSSTTTSSSTTALRRRRLAQTSSSGSSSSSPLGLIWAVSPYSGLVQHRSSDVGGFWLDLTSGSAGEQQGDKQAWITAHGALMAVAWGLLLPLGTLLPAHRRLLGGSKLGSKAAWFVLHLVCQWVGVALFVAGFVIGFWKLGDGTDSGDEVVRAHCDIGIAVMGAAGAQVLLAYVRPDPGAPRRRLWNLVHHNLGRGATLLAWANVYVGVYVYHEGQWGASYTAWITPIAAVMGALVLVDVVLRLTTKTTTTTTTTSTQDPALPPQYGGTAAPGYMLPPPPPPRGLQQYDDAVYLQAAARGPYPYPPAAPLVPAAAAGKGGAAASTSSSSQLYASSSSQYTQLADMAAGRQHHQQHQQQQQPVVGYPAVPPPPPQRWPQGNAFVQAPPTPPRP